MSYQFLPIFTKYLQNNLHTAVYFIKMFAQNLAKYIFGWNFEALSEIFQQLLTSLPTNFKQHIENVIRYYRMTPSKPDTCYLMVQ